MSTKAKVSEFIARYSPSIACQFRQARAKVRALFPRGYELVFDSYNALGCGFSISPRASGVVISVVAYPKWVTLFFFHGTHLPDPDRILQGSGKQIRSIRLQPPSLLGSKAVRTLLATAVAQFKEELAHAPAISTVVKAEAAMRRPRRPPPPAKKKVAARRVPRVA